MMESCQRAIDAAVKKERERIAEELRQLAYEKADGNHVLHEYDVTDYADKLGKP